MGCPSIPDRDHKLIMNILFFLYSSEKYSSINQIQSHSSLSDYSPGEILQELKSMSTELNVEIKSENESPNRDSEVYKIGNDGKIPVDTTIDDYLENPGDICDGLENEEGAFKELENISKNPNRYELAKNIQDFVSTYKNGNYYSGF